MGEKETATAESLKAAPPKKAEEAIVSERMGEEPSDDELGDDGRVKGSKSNTSERTSIQDFEKPSEATTVKSGKSNSSDRWQDGDPTDDNTDDDDTPNRVKGSKSNSSERATSVKSSKSNTSE